MFAYVASVSEVYCKHLFSMFHLFYTYAASVLSGCYICSKCFIYILHVFAMVFLQVFQMHVSYVFFCMLPVLYLNVLKVD
jgi:hypothetical protein